MGVKPLQSKRRGGFETRPYVLTHNPPNPQNPPVTGKVFCASNVIPAKAGIQKSQAQNTARNARKPLPQGEKGGGVENLPAR